MSALTTKLSLYKPGGGSTGLILPDEVVDIDKINSNMDKIDAAIGAPVYTSVTRPAVPFDGQLIVESDTGLLNVYRSTGAAWVYPNSILVVVDLNALPSASQFEGRTIHVDSMNVDFQAQDNVWIQQGPATFADAATRDAEYAKAGGVYKVAGARVRRTDKFWTEEYRTVAYGVAVAGWFPVDGKFPSAKLTGVGNPSIANSAWAIVTTFASTGAGGYLHGVTETLGTLVVEQAGEYEVRGGAAFLTNSVGARVSALMLNSLLSPGVAPLSAVGYSAGMANPITVHSQIAMARVKLAVGDIIRLNVYQSSGGALSLAAPAAEGGVGSSLELHYMSPS